MSSSGQGLANVQGTAHSKASAPCCGPRHTWPRLIWTRKPPSVRSPCSPRQREQKRQDRIRLAQQAQNVRTEWRTQQENFTRGKSRPTTSAISKPPWSTASAKIISSIWRSSTPRPTRPCPSRPRKKLPEKWRCPCRRQSMPFARLPGPLDPAAVNEEITELRRKLSRLGSVNLDSLA